MPPMKILVDVTKLITIVVFGLLGALASYLSMRVLREPYARLARLFALMALLWVNFGFWVGSLWGDHPLEAWVAPDAASTPTERRPGRRCRPGKPKRSSSRGMYSRWCGRWRW